MSSFLVAARSSRSSAAPDRARHGLARRLVAVRADRVVGALLALHEFYGWRGRCVRSCSPATRARSSHSSARSSAGSRGCSAASSRRSRSPSCSGDRRHAPVRDRRRRHDGARRRPGSALGLGHLVLLRDIPEHGRLARLHRPARDLRRRHARLLRRPRSSAGTSWRRDLAGEDVEGFVGGTLAAVAVTFFALYEDRDTSCRSGSRWSSASRRAPPSRSATSSSRRSSATCR